jgi:hypothetical protein
MIHCDCKESKELGLNATITEKLVKLNDIFYQRIAICSHCSTVLDVKQDKFYEVKQ